MKFLEVQNHRKDITNLINLDKILAIQLDQDSKELILALGCNVNLVFKEKEYPIHTIYTSITMSLNKIKI